MCVCVPGLLPQAKQATLDVHTSTVLRGTGLAFVDLRWQRSFRWEESSQFMGSHQVAGLVATIKEWEADPSVTRLAMFSAIPLLYQGVFPAQIADWVENEKYSTVPVHQNETLAVLRTLRDGFSGYKLLLAGDLHMFYDSSICTDAHSPCLRSLVTSGLTKSASTLKAVRAVAMSGRVCCVMGGTHSHPLMPPPHRLIWRCTPH